MEGSLGIRRIHIIRQCMHVKLLWLAMKGHSLWERYAKAKYSRGNSFIVTGPRVSPLWTSIVAHYSLLNMNTRWILGRGDLSFWGDNWIGTQLIGPQPLDMNITVREGLNIMRSTNSIGDEAQNTWRGFGPQQRRSFSFYIS